ncbi:PREDICTED: DNA-directed RNA polymerase I subunit RPA34 [Gekko japonicus]|uniref:DNA-directed RNA polymerase I subunit RPA34 n=1 Tax=Gekko japonicus TaxID=146911 RepID=A0ABM1JM34_GEKJA|nr:PREDICTED: DNA-directed RNA polymerase I subunit RPA34 [Gekko japonicus]
MEAPREQAEASAAREAHVGMEAPAGPPRFKCPPDFSASPFIPGPPFSQEALQDPAKELWLIRAPANFSPESLNGHSVPLLGFQMLKAPQPGGTEKIFHVQTALEHLGGAHLLLHSGQGGRLACSPPFGGSLNVCERHGDLGGNQPLFPVAARPAPRIPAGLRQSFLPFGSNPESAPLPGAVEEPPRKKKKKMKKQHRLGEEEDRPPLFGMPLGETTGAGETEAGGPHEVHGVGSQPGSAAVAQNSVLPAEPEDLAPLSKKKKKKRKEERERKEETAGEAETGQRHEDGAAPPATDPQLSSAADAQNGLLSGEAEDLAPLSKKKKKKRKEERERKEEVGEEAASATRQHEEGGVAGGALGPEAPLTSAAFAHDGLLSGEAEAAGPGSKKKKKKKREEDGERKEETRGEAASPHQADGTAPWAVGSQPDPAAVGQDGLLSGEAEDPAPLSKKKKRGEGGELGGETEATQPPREEGAAPRGISPQPHAEPVAQEGPLSGRVEDPSPRRQKKKKKRRDEREVKEETGTGTEAARPPEENGAAPWETSSQPSSGLTAQEGLLSGEAEGPASGSKKKKKKKRKEETGREAEGLSSCPGGDSLPGLEEATQGTHEKAAPPEPFSGQGDAAGVLRDFRGELVLAEEEEEQQPGAGSSSHKAKKKKRKKEKEKPEEEAAQELGGRPAQQGAESWAEPGTPLGGGGGGGGGQEAEPGREELSQKRKKREHHRRGQGAEEGPAGLEKEVGNA